jgi:hypothetical protein
MDLSSTLFSRSYQSSSRDLVPWRLDLSDTGFGGIFGALKSHNEFETSVNSNCCCYSRVFRDFEILIHFSGTSGGVTWCVRQTLETWTNDSNKIVIALHTSSTGISSLRSTEWCSDAVDAVST